jgi:hypothetical protein
MPAGMPAGVMRIRQRAGLDGEVGSVWGVLPVVTLVSGESEGAKAMVSSSLASVASTLSSSCS